MLEFIRDGHQDAILVRRFQQAAGTLRFDGSVWRFRQHGAALLDGSSVLSLVGAVKSRFFAPGALRFWVQMESNEWEHLADAMQALSDADPKAKGIDCPKDASRLLASFRRYTHHKNAA